MFENELHELHLMQQIYATLFSVSNKIQAYCDEALGDISSRQLMAMIAIAHLPPKDSTLKRVAAMLGTSKQNANKLLNSLQKKGYIETARSETDKRAINVRFTEPGIQTMHEGARKSIFAMAVIFKHLETNELEMLWRLLKKVSKFDGLPYSGFEEDANQTEMDAEAENTMHEFKRIRRADD